MCIFLRYLFSMLSVAVLGLLSTSALAQSRPDCISSLGEPGACFSEGNPPGEVFIGCNMPGESDIVEGILVWENFGSGENDFDRTTPNGKEFAHISDRDLETIYCPWDTVFSGLCTADSAAPEYLYYGVSDVQNNGYFVGPGEPGCPFVMTSRGEVTRPVDGDTLELNVMLKFGSDESHRLQPAGMQDSQVGRSRPGFASRMR
ncbi:MAG: hypothetical protein P8102_13230 [Gammaproteobacteria bacterium]